MSQSGADLIRIERQRQVTVEEYTAAHDKGHALELTQAATSYGRYVGWVLEGRDPQPAPPTPWPWDERFFKPTGDPVRNLVKAGALIAAAIDSIIEGAEQ